MSLLFPSNALWIVLQDGEEESARLPLHPEEVHLGERYRHPVRRESFYLGRKAARKVLRELGIADHVPVLKGQGEEPLWPPGIVGSIAHSGSFAAAVVGSHIQYAGLGIDIEMLAKRISFSLSRRLCSPRELEAFSGSSEDRIMQLLKIFSAKEAFYKAAYPTIKRPLGFRDVELHFAEAWLSYFGRIIEPKESEIDLNITGELMIREDLLMSSAVFYRDEEVLEDGSE